MSKSAWPYLILACGVLVVASASIMIRYAQQTGMSSLLIATGRLLFAALLLQPLALTRNRTAIRQLSRRDLLFGIGAGVLLAIHFAAWISSLEFTSVASSVALVATSPLWVGLFSWLVLRERLSLFMSLGILLTIGGSVLIAYSDSVTGGTNATLGNGLALLGALAVSGYFLTGRKLRHRLSTLTYVWLVYSSAAVVLLIALVLSGGLKGITGYPPLAYLLLLGLAIGPQLLGHTSFNWALRYVSATFVTVTILGEPLGSAILALFFFGERFHTLQLAGFVVLMLGILVAARAEQPTSTETQIAPQEASGNLPGA